MTAASIEQVRASASDPFSVGHEVESRPKLRLVAAPSQPSSLLGGSSLSAPIWINELARNLDESATGREVSAGTLMRCLTWIFTLPRGVTLPMVSVGDDMSVSLEWENAEGTLHVLFDDCFDEWYFEDVQGNEAEHKLGVAQNVLIHALQVAAR